MALRDVNLIPDQVLQRRYVSRHVVGWAIGYALISAALIGGNVMYARANVIEHHHEMSHQQIATRHAAALANIEARKAEFSRLAFVRDIHSPVGPDQILGHLAAVMPDDIWLTRLAVVSTPGSEPELTLIGLARSNARLGEMIRDLNQHAAFKDVLLGGASERNPDRDNPEDTEVLIQFSASAKVVTRSTP